jgi:NAD(P)-dependent dehydrogenase (short-subunit alcohol dehydrogenase family)
MRSEAECLVYWSLALRRPELWATPSSSGRLRGRSLGGIAGQMIDLRERVAVVTGAGRGIGRAYATRLAAYGARVIVNDAGVATDGAVTDEDPAAEVVGEILAAGGVAVAHRGDISDSEVGDALVQQALDTWGRLDVVINNAGFGRPRMAFNLGDDEWDDVIRVHLRGTFVVSRPALRHWRAQAKTHGSTYGRVINTATGLLLYGGAGQSNYVAAKAGVQAFTEAIATEMAPYGVTANTIMPGANTRLAQIGWRMERNAASNSRSGEAEPPEFDPRDPVHVGEFGAYLASPDAGWISGQTFQVRGGIVEHVETWSVRDTARSVDRGFTADDYCSEIPRLFGASAKRADPPPAQWTANRP